MHYFISKGKRVVLISFEKKVLITAVWSMPFVKGLSLFYCKTDIREKPLEEVVTSWRESIVTYSLFK